MPLTITYNGDPWLSANSTPNYQANYNDEKWKIPSLFVQTQKDRENIRNIGLHREIPQANYYYWGLEVKVDEEIF